MKDIKRGVPVSKGDYTEHPYSLEVQGNFHDFVMFLTDLPTLSRIVTVKNLKLTGSKDEREKYSLKVSFTASFYTSPIGQAKPLKKTETKGGKKK
jgi:Tfp pilus assembly protein PilO